ncbi:MAG: hypothetical protein M5U05_18720 [Anaerolineales bacterium]|nr:hypothetical protein [Anaerolineales bacterium]
MTPVVVIPPGGGTQVDRCPICKNPIDECTCGTVLPPVREALQGSGAPAQAFQRIHDLCADQEVEWLRQLTINIQGDGQQGANEVRALGLAIPQMGKGSFWVEQSLTAEFDGGEQIHVSFKGGWDRYKRLKQVTDTFAQEGRKVNARTTLTVGFPQGLEVRGDQFRTIYDVFSQMGFGHITVRAEPSEEDGH